MQTHGLQRYLFDDRSEDASIALIVDAVSEREVDGVVLSLPHTCKGADDNVNTCQVKQGQNSATTATTAHVKFLAKYVGCFYNSRPRDLTNILHVARAREVLSELVERHRHDSVRGVEGLL